MLMQSNALLKPRIIDVQSTSPRPGAGDRWSRSSAAFGHTLGNALRRILLSSLPGHARDRGGDRRECCTSTPRSTVSARTSSTLLLNLKGVVFKLHNGRSEGDGHGWPSRARVW
jgi:DNA-directed RNA polymerase subunit alpha